MLNRIYLIFSLIIFVILIMVKENYGISSNGVSEYQVKAVFLYNFAKFIEWPPTMFENNDNITLCVLGEDPFGNFLSSLEGKNIKDKKFAIKRIKTIKNIKQCHILFISSSEKNHLYNIFNYIKVKGLNVLTVGDTKGFTQKGGIINFIIINNKVRFEINIDAAKQAGLKISSKLLKLAKIVQGDKKKEE